MHSLTAKEEEKNPLNTETRKQIFQLLNPFTGRDGSDTSIAIFIIRAQRLGHML